MKTYRIKHRSGVNRNKVEYSFLDANSKEDAILDILCYANWLGEEDIFEIKEV